MKKTEFRSLIRQEVRRMIKESLSSENTFNTALDPNFTDDVPTVNMYIDDADGKDKLFVEVSAMFHSGDNGKVAVLKNNQQLRDQVVAELQKEIQAAFRKVIHGLAGEPYGLK